MEKSFGVPVLSAKVIREWRIRAGLTQEELARLIGVTFSSISRWENDRVNPSKLARRAIVRLAEEMQCSLSHPVNNSKPHKIEGVAGVDY